MTTFKEINPNPANELIDLSVENLLKLDNEQLNDYELDVLAENEHVTSIESLGFSGFHPGLEWFSVELDNGKDINIYYEPICCEDLR